ncbi:unnamed protein product [Nezara viridula]|uniref:Uncharacterized protein n=1 Tax=Nezara viridula TaxID=85310 RepID=A0A9P0HTL6_NEZVI|nr:unnamed protein product [Nezara viridula]
MGLLQYLLCWCLESYRFFLKIMFNRILDKLWSKISGKHKNDEEDTDKSSLFDSSLSESDSTDSELTDENKENENESNPQQKRRRRRRVRKDEPTDGWEEICGIDVDVLEDVMLTKIHKIRNTSKYISERDIKVPTIEENRERLNSAYNLWLKYRPGDSQVFMPKWERILEKPMLEQSVLVDEYVKKVFYLLKLKEVPEYNIPEGIPKGDVLIRDPNKPGTFIKLNDVLEQKPQIPKKQDLDSCKEIFSNIASSSRFKVDESNANLSLLKRNCPLSRT